MKKYLSLLLLVVLIAAIGCFSASEEKSSGTSGTTEEINNDVAKDPADGSFLYQSFDDVGMQLKVYDKDKKPVNRAVVSVMDNSDRSARAQTEVDGIIYQTFTDENGVAVLDMAISPSETSLKIVIYKAGLVETTIIVEDTRTIALINRVLYTEEETNTITEPDSDGDGIPDKYDALVHDPDMMVFTKRDYRIAFEDLYPIKDLNILDADFNDVVVHAAVSVYCNTIDYRNIKKILVRSKMYAAGAGYDDVSMHLNMLGKTYTLYDDVKEPLTDGNGVFHPNTDNTKDFYGDALIRDLNILMDETDISQIGIPLDIYIFVPKANKKIYENDPDPEIAALYRDEEIHSVNLKNYPEYNDKYLRVDGFPWVLTVASNDWKWPAEGNDINDVYEYFDDWYIYRKTDVLDPAIPININKWYDYPRENPEPTQEVYTKCPGFIPLPATP